MSSTGRDQGRGERGGGGGGRGVLIFMHSRSPYDRGLSHTCNAGTEHVRFSQTRLKLLAPSGGRGGGLSERWGGIEDRTEGRGGGVLICCLPWSFDR